MITSPVAHWKQIITNFQFTIYYSSHPYSSQKHIIWTEHDKLSFLNECTFTKVTMYIIFQNLWVLNIVSVHLQHFSKEIKNSKVFNENHGKINENAFTNFFQLSCDQSDVTIAYLTRFKLSSDSKSSRGERRSNKKNKSKQFDSTVHFNPGPSPKCYKISFATSPLHSIDITF